MNREEKIEKITREDIEWLHINFDDEFRPSTYAILDFRDVTIITNEDGTEFWKVPSLTSFVELRDRKTPDKVVSAWVEHESGRTYVMRRDTG